jgi:hypothetical protein
VSATSTLAVALVGATLAILALWYSFRLVGWVAERFGEDPARWQLLMAPFNIFGPFVAWLILSRRNGGRGGRYA